MSVDPNMRSSADLPCKWIWIAVGADFRVFGGMDVGLRLDDERVQSIADPNTLQLDV